MSTPLVSIVIPAYNAEAYIERTIRSALEQTYPNIEVVVVNDGSKDRTAAVVESIRDPRILLLSQPNGGVSIARNKGMEASSGAYIALLDADDGLEPEAMALKVGALVQNGCDWVFSDVLACDPELVPFGVMKGADVDIIRTLLLGITTPVPAPCSNVVFTRRCFMDGTRFLPQLSNAADRLFVLTLAKAYRHQYIAKPLVRYRILANSMSRNVALFEADHNRLMQAAADMELLDDPRFARICKANAAWAIGGSWWRDGKAPLKGLPHLLRAVLTDPAILLRRMSRERSGRTSIRPLNG
ncbi:MAG: glycosyltransferase [Flavobacteriales bacterium]|nr:glycosyltransferase [Flavobacteriales bacterium]